MRQLPVAFGLLLLGYASNSAASRSLPCTAMRAMKTVCVMLRKSGRALRTSNVHTVSPVARFSAEIFPFTAAG